MPRCEPPEGLRVPDGTCLLAYRGSIAHGMRAANTQDTDILGVVLAPATHYLGLTEWGSRGTVECRSGSYDCVFYEIRKLVGLLLRGNPNAMSVLWLDEPDYLYRDDTGREIIAHRHLFVSKAVYDSFAAYAAAQLARMETRDPAELRRYLAVTHELKHRGAHPNHKGEKIAYPDEFSVESGEAKDAARTSTGILLAQLRHFQRKGENLGRLGDKRKQTVLEHGYDAKNAAHCIRLLRMGREFLATGELIVRRPDAAELLAIRAGEWPLARIQAHAAELMADAQAARDASPLPEQPDRAAAEQLLVRLLRRHLARTDAADGPQAGGS